MNKQSFNIRNQHRCIPNNTPTKEIWSKNDKMTITVTNTLTKTEQRHYAIYSFVSLITLL